MSPFESSDRQPEQSFSPISTDQVMALWLWLVRGECPWRHMHADDVTGCLRSIIGAVVDEHHVTLAARRSAVQWAAAQHGRFRRGQRCEARVISQDLVVLGEAFAEVWGRAPRALDLPDIGAGLRCASRAAHAGHQGTDA